MLLDNRLFNLIFSVLVLTAITSLVLAGFVTTRQLVAPPVVSYSASEYPARDSEVCPGDLLIVPYQVKITVAPTVIIVYETIWSKNLEKTVVADANPVAVIHPIRRTVETQSTYIIPDLPSGEYEYRHASGETFSQVATFTTHFTIPVGCP